VLCGRTVSLCTCWRGRGSLDSDQPIIARRHAALLSINRYYAGDGEGPDDDMMKDALHAKGQYQHIRAVPLRGGEASAHVPWCYCLQSYC
jgi:hypothetical protein